MKSSLVSLSLLLLLCAAAFAERTRCDNLSDGGGSCNGSDDCKNVCAIVLSLHSGLNPLLPGFVTGFVGRRIIVTGIIPFSPASQAGVKIGDRLVSVDGVRLPAPYGLSSVWQRKGEHRLTVERSGRVLAISLTPVPEQVLLARAWSEFDPLGERPLQLVDFAKPRQAPSSFAFHRAFVTGIKTTQMHGRMTVEKVLRGSAADTAGVHAGDVILRSSTNQMEASDSRTFVVLTVRREGVLRAFRFRMTSLSEVLEMQAHKAPSRSAAGTNAGF